MLHCRMTTREHGELYLDMISPASELLDWADMCCHALNAVLKSQECLVNVSLNFELTVTS